MKNSSWEKLYLDTSVISYLDHLNQIDYNMIETDEKTMEIAGKFKHVVNGKTIRGIKAVTTYEGYKDLMIYSPSTLLDEEDAYGSNDAGTRDQRTL